MKVKTNLSPTELRRIGVGLQKLADSQQRSEIELENPAERKLLNQASGVFDVVLQNLIQEMDNILDR